MSFLKKKFTMHWKDFIILWWSFLFWRSFSSQWTILKTILLINARSSSECSQLMLKHKTGKKKHYKKLQVIVQQHERAHGFWELDVNFMGTPVQFSQYVYNNNKLVLTIDSHSCEHLWAFEVGSHMLRCQLIFIVNIRLATELIKIEWTFENCPTLT